MTIETPLTTLRSKPTFTYLGAIFDSRLAFKDQLTKVHNSALAILNTLQTIVHSRFNISSSFFYKIYKGTILP